MLRTRRAIAVAALAFLAAVVAVDFSVSATPNPFVQPPLIALGSGQAASGALCTTAPPR
jgi:hypothetical protein